MPDTQDCEGPAAAFVTFTRETGAPTGLFRIHSNCLDGSAERLLFSETVPTPTGHTSGLARVAPDGKRIAYSPPRSQRNDGGLYLLAANGQGRARIVEQPIHSFAWRPDSKALLYAPAPTPSARASEGYPLISSGFEWRLWTLQDARTIPIGDLRPRKTHEEYETDFTWRYVSFFAWARRDRLLFGGQSLFSTQLFVHDLQSGVGTIGTHLPWSMAQIGARSQTARLRTAAIVYPPADDGRQCRIAEITPAWTRILVATPDHRCEGIAWNGEHEIFYGKGTGPRGRILIGEKSGSGHDVLMSIHRYDLRTGREHKVLMSDGTEIYGLMGLLPGKAMIVLNESGLAGRARYMLESRRLDGTRPARLYEGYARPFFIGWVQPVS